MSRLSERGIHPFSAYEWYAEEAIVVPDVEEFVCSDRYLNRPNIYPRQLTLLKAIFLQTEVMTQYDWDVLEMWANDFEQTGNHGIVPDIEQRIEMCRAEGRKWFRENVIIIGRRGSKGYSGGIAGAYVLWHYLAKSDPQEFYGVDRDKRLSAMVFAGKKEQAKANQWKDYVNVVLGSNCFAPYISRPQAESLTVFAPADFRKMLEREQRGLDLEVDMATFEVIPKESTAMAGRGPAAFSQHYDEMAHVVATSGAARSAEEVYEAATPALDQFGLDGFIFEGSSPWQQTGQFFENYEMSLEREPNEETGAEEPVYHDMFMCQLTSWDPYEDWERSQMIRRAPGKGGFKKLKGPIQSYNTAMRKLERANPDSFKVERRSHFATVLDAYLRPERIVDMFQKPWNGRALEMQSHGRLAVLYKAHADPSKSNARFGFAIAHTEPDPDDPDISHVVFDVIHAWDPADYPDHELDYVEVEKDLWQFVERFVPFELTFDQYNSASAISKFRRKIQKAKFPRTVSVYEKTATAPVNWQRFEVFKTALNMGWVHAPYHEIAELELKFLQEKRPGLVDHPETGPVTTKDVADCIVECTYSLIGAQVAEVAKQLGEVQVGVSVPHGANPYNAVAKEDSVHEALSQFGNMAARGGSGMGGMRPRR